MTVLTVLAWILFGILGGLFCAVMVGGLMLLADLRPRSRKAALGLVAVVGLGVVGGVLAGLLVLAIAIQTQGGQSVSGAVVGGCIGCFLLPFTTNGLYPLVIARLTSSTRDSGSAHALIRPLGCVIGILAFFAGAYLGAQLGSVVGASSFLLGGALGPFVGGALALVIPLQLWVTLHSETYSWSAPGRASRRTRVSARGWMRMSELQRGARARSRRWD